MPKETRYTKLRNDRVAAWELRYWTQLLTKYRGDMTAVSAAAQIDKRNAYRHMTRLGIDYASFRALRKKVDPDSLEAFLNSDLPKTPPTDTGADTPM